MLSHNLEEIFEDANKFGHKEKLLNKWKLFILKFLIKIFKPKYIRAYRMKTQLLFEIFLNTLMSFQMIALTWYPDMNIAGWNRYSSFWRFISFFNLIDACSLFRIMEFSFYAIALVLAFCAGALIAMLLIEFAKSKTPKFLIKILNGVFSALSTVLYIPSLLELSLIYKYSTFKYDKAYELAGSKDPSLLDYGILGTLISAVFIAFLIITAFLRELFTTDIRHSHRWKILTVKAHSSVDLKLLAFKSLMSIAYVSFGNTEPTRFQIIFLIASIWIFLEFLRKIPYYNKSVNCIKCCKMFSVILSLFAVFLGKLMNDAGVIFMLIFFMQPFSVLIISWFVISKPNNKIFNTINENNQYKFERSIRYLLFNKNLEDKTIVINYFSDCYKNKSLIKDKLLVIWEVNYCSYIMKNQQLARIKLTKKKSIISTLEGIIQELRAIKIIDKKDHSSIDSLYIQYLEELKKAKAQDLEVCCTLLDLWSELAANIPQYKKIHHFAIKSCRLLSELKDFYAQLVSKHRYLELYDLYITFLQNISGDFDQASNINRLKANINHQLSFTTIYESNICLEDSGIILVSANEINFGTITHINNKASQLLKGTISDLIGTNLNDYIPSVFSYNHLYLMKKFYIDYVEEEIAHQGLFFIQNSLGYLVECRIHIKLSAFHSNAYFLISINPIATTRQLALISEDWTIFNYTELFPHYIGAATNTVKNCFISDFFPGLNISEMKPYEPLIIQKNNKILALIHTVKELRTKSIHMLLVVHDENEINLWKVGKDISQIEYFKKIEPSQSLEEINSKISSDYLMVKQQELTPLISTSLEKQEDIKGLIDEKTSKKYSNLDYTEEKASNIRLSSSSSSTKSDFNIEIVNRNIEALTRKLKIFQKILILCVKIYLDISSY